MADTFASAQHFIECDSCEENPAKFICKTCPGNLCQKCKSEHEDRKITQNHEVVEFTSNQDLINHLFCSEHKTKKLECFCGPCKKPVCTDCIVWAHNGHAIQSLSIALEEIKDELQKKKEKIENDLCIYTSVLQKEVQKELNLAKQADEIEKQIEKHTEHVVEMVKETSKRAVEDLRVKEQTGRKEINTSVADMRKCIQILTQRKEQLSDKIKGRLKMTFFEPENNDSSEKQNEEMEKIFSNLTNYELDEFKPGQIGVLIPSYFGTPPDLKIIRANPLPPPPPPFPSPPPSPPPSTVLGMQPKPFQPSPSPPPPMMSNQQTIQRLPPPQLQPQPLVTIQQSQPIASRHEPPSQTLVLRQQPQQPPPQQQGFGQPWRPSMISRSQSPPVMSRQQPQPVRSSQPWQTPMMSRSQSPTMMSRNQPQQPPSQQLMYRQNSAQPHQAQKLVFVNSNPEHLLSRYEPTTQPHVPMPQPQQPQPQPQGSQQPWQLMSGSQSSPMMSRHQQQQPPTQPSGTVHPWQPSMMPRPQSTQPPSQQFLSQQRQTPQHRKQLKPSDFGLSDYSWNN